MFLLRVGYHTFVLLFCEVFPLGSMVLVTVSSSESYCCCQLHLVLEVAEGWAPPMPPSFLEPSGPEIAEEWAPPRSPPQGEAREKEMSNFMCFSGVMNTKRGVDTWTHPDTEMAPDNYCEALVVGSGSKCDTLTVGSESYCEILNNESGSNLNFEIPVF